MTELTHIDCFAGPGGICTGFRAAGIKTVLAIEKVGSCVETYAANHPEVPVIQQDIRKVDSKEIRRYWKGKIDIVTSGMPCETFSTAGNKSRSFYDHRQFLFAEGIRIAKIVDAKVVLFENVKGITSKMTEKGGNRLIIDELFDQLSANGYKYYVDTILDAADFGVPQHRRRFFVLATKDPNIELQIPISKRNGMVTVADAFKGLPHLEANEGKELTRYSAGESNYTNLLKNAEFWRLPKTAARLTYHISPKHREGTLKRLALIKPGEGLKDLFEKYNAKQREKLQKEKILPKKWFIQRNRRLIEKEPCVTVTSHCLDELVHPSIDRSLTVREVARLQSFPDAYDFKGGPLICPHIYETQDKYEQIGDAVPPLLAYQWGCVIKKILKSQL
jgi:DNA (cytosine-5)-methyltransferase 1